MLDTRHVRMRLFRCPVCGPSIAVRLNLTDWGVRCVRCGSAPNTLSIVKTLKERVPNLRSLSVYALTAAGPLFDFLERECANLTCSLYYADVAPGEFREGVLCQDVQSLTFDDNSFDLCLHSEVFEHVPDDARGFREIFRVLKPNGLTVFTVPVFKRETTVERARLVNGEVQHLLSAEYHNDQLRGSVLAFRDYGRDVLARLREAGFGDVGMASPFGPFGNPYVEDAFERTVIVATKRIG